MQCMQHQYMVFYFCHICTLNIIHKTNVPINSLNNSMRKTKTKTRLL